jgi:hypothetical protein
VGYSVKRAFLLGLVCAASVQEYRLEFSRFQQIKEGSANV